MTTHYVLYRPDGTLTQVGFGLDADVAYLGTIMPLVLIPAAPSDILSYLAENCVVESQIVPKVSMGLSVSTTSFAANGTAEATISGVPVGALATISGAVSAGPEAITDGTLTLTSNVAGSILVTISAPPMYFDWSITLNAT
jgi:hypothetical protein